jgi:hypothetical protein
MMDTQLIGLSKWDLQVEINICKKKDDIFIVKHHIKIPISPYTIWFFIRHKIKCKVTWGNV